MLILSTLGKCLGRLSHSFGPAVRTINEHSPSDDSPLYSLARANNRRSPSFPMHSKLFLTR